MKENKSVFWFATGSQDLYGEACLAEVASHSSEMVSGMNASGILPFEIVFKAVLIDAESINRLFSDADKDPCCAGVITWMHTFSPAKMWICGLRNFRKPLMHLHTQFNSALPFSTIDMDFMNTNQSAHGDREFAHLLTRLNIPRKTVAGHWRNAGVLRRIAGWMRTAAGINESRQVRIARFGDNMRDVAVTEGDKVAAEIAFGWKVDAYSAEDLAKYVDAVSSADSAALTEEYYRLYSVNAAGRSPEEFRRHVEVQASIELGLRRFLEERGYNAVVTNFQTLSGLKQLPGLAIQRLMADGYGFGAEGDWKTAAMVRIMKVMAKTVPNPRGTSFFEDYTYHFDDAGSGAILQAHMLEVCPSVAASRPEIRVEFLSMGEREDPARLVFTSKPGRGVACSLVDLGARFRLIVNDVECLPQENPMPRLPVASALWRPFPDLERGAEAWLTAGGAHHTAFSYDLDAGQLGDWADAMGVECVFIDADTDLRTFRNELRWNEAAFSR